MSGWSCIHDDRGTCARVVGRPCDPGMKGCILAGRFRFTNPAKNRPSSPPPAPADEKASSSRNGGQKDMPAVPPGLRIQISD